MTAQPHTRRTTTLRRALASLLRARRTSDAPGTPDVWLAGLRLGG
ncbi:MULTISPECIES: hypothetical protein [unclassified Streptomyces]|nr:MULTISPECIES: hypothetical protein [unclassified Streptomyces]MCX5053113.1 hypothetical protein [Streptomyces sp. NBC_00474]MCX5059618.1 hypothetical protein [Streptomyces sp. NBC_00452]MCX5243735.1 hypothetical protein [Streptomyces sp. NBC_00201]MCX5290530.1 hypothetical protein [Streptomyces sp. NBC_00183]